MALMNRVCDYKSGYPEFPRVCVEYKSNRVVGICLNHDEYYAANKEAESALLQHLRRNSRGLRLFVTGIIVSLMVGLRYFYGSSKK